MLIPILLLVYAPSNAQTANEPKNNPEAYSKPYPPFRIAGNLYYVGTYDLASYLVVTDKGSILINTGLSNSLDIIKKNIAGLGFKFEDIKILLTTQAHYDHLGAMAAIKKLTGAKFCVDAGDAGVVQSGGATDYELSRLGVSFTPIRPDRILKDQSVIQLGNTKLMTLHHPGHTKGSCSYLLTVRDSSRSWRVLIANMPSVIVERKFAEVTTYPAIEKDYAYTFRAMRKLQFDIWVASHASQFKLHEKHKPGDAYNPAAFADSEGYFEELNQQEKGFFSKQNNATEAQKH